MPGMKVKVDFDLCESNAVCMGILPEVFEVRDDDFLYILTYTTSPSQEAKLRQIFDDSAHTFELTD